ncbi:hypothetical protein AgCh_028177 [Apium graveolens]
MFDQRKSKSFVNHKSTRAASEQPLNLLKIFNVFPGYWTKASKCSLQVEPLPLEYTPERQQQLEIPDNHSLTSLWKIISVGHSQYEEYNVLDDTKVDSTSEETVYQDDIAEFMYSICKDVDIIQDQSSFHFKFSNIPTQRKSSYLGATSMPCERPKNVQSDSILRSTSFPIEHSINHLINAPRSPHVHPKLPEYDDIVQQFLALKEAAMQKKCMEERSNSLRFQHSTNHWNIAPPPQVHA